MKPKLKPDYDPESIQADLIETVCNSYKPGVSVRALAKEMELSPMKVRKILITGGVYSTDTSTEIGELYKDGKTVGEIAAILGCSVASVNSYLPYERIIYGMDERSVEADRQARYRERKKAGVEQPEKTKVTIERVRNKTMIIVIGKKLRKAIPAGVLDDSSDPLARDKSYTWGSNVGGEFTLHEPVDPDKSIWCAEVTTSGRGKDKKQGVVLMSANSGFAVISALPLFTPVDPEQPTVDELKEYRSRLEEEWISAIRSGLFAFSMPKEKVLDYTDTVARIELVKGRASTPAKRLEEFIEKELNWDAGDDPVAQFNIRGNWTNRKFGNSGSYRHVEEAVCYMLGLTATEAQKWIFDFLAPMRETMKAGE